MIYERIEVDVTPPELCVRVRALSDASDEILARGVAVCGDNSVYVKGNYVGELVGITYEQEFIHVMGLLADEQPPPIVTETHLQVAHKP